MAERIEFYSMHCSAKTKEKVVILHKGYTDGTYNYYGKNGIWYVIEPDTGLSVVKGFSAKEIKKIAHDPECIKKLRDFRNTSVYDQFAREFKSLVEKAKKSKRKKGK